tara:strand:- start:946 stop:1320 length:375 start_codon:yes stop_codon:yes gene_type:complete
MNFSVLTNDNYMLFAMKHYDNPQSVTYDDFQEDMMRFKYLKRLFGRYVKSGVLRNHLILNHLIVLFNVFGEAAIPLLIFKIEMEYWSIMKSYLLYLNRLDPEGGNGILDEIVIDAEVTSQLSKL